MVTAADNLKRAEELGEIAYTQVVRVFALQEFHWGRERLLSDLRRQLAISNEAHAEIMTAIMDGYEPPRIKMAAAARAAALHEDHELDKDILGHEQWSPTAGSYIENHVNGHASAPVPYASTSPVHQPPRNGMSGMNGGTFDHDVHGSKNTWLPPVHNKHEMTSAARRHANGTASKPSRKRSAGAGPYAKPTKKARGKELAVQAAPALQLDSLLGHRVRVWWPDQGGWWTGVITDFSRASGQHCICYDMNTAEESFEWTQVRGASSDEVLVLDEKIDLALLQARPIGNATNLAMQSPAEESSADPLSDEAMRQLSQPGLQQQASHVANGRYDRRQLADTAYRDAHYQPKSLVNDNRGSRQKFQVVSDSSLESESEGAESDASYL